MQISIESLEKEIEPLMGRMALVLLKLLQKNNIQNLSLNTSIGSDEFYSFRPYILGQDDSKKLNWKLMAKYQKPFVIEQESEEEYIPSILIDSSGSMLLKKKRLLEILYFLLKIFRRQTINLFWGEYNYLQIPLQRANICDIIEELASIKLEGKSNLPNLISNLKVIHKIPNQSPLIILTDLIDFTGCEESIHHLYKKYTLLLIHLKSQSDHSLPQIGYSYIKDPETGKLLLLNFSDKRAKAIYQQSSEEKEKQIYTSLKNFVNFWKIYIDLPLNDNYEESLFVLNNIV